MDLKPMNTADIPAPLVEEMTQLEIRTQKYLEDHARIKAEGLEIKAQQKRLREKLLPYCPCSKCKREREAAKSDGTHDGRVMLTLIVITIFVIGYLCGVGR